MPTEYNCYQINDALENIWLKTQTFWKQNKGEIIEETLSKNRLYRNLKIKTDLRMRPYAYSFGELYSMQFGYDIERKCTIATIVVKYSILRGRGFIGKLAQETIDNWAKELNLQPDKLKSDPFPLYLEEENKIKQIAEQAESLGTKFCVHCGAKSSISGKNCTLCGAEL